MVYPTENATETMGPDMGFIDIQKVFSPDPLMSLPAGGSLTPPSPASTFTSSDATSATTDSLPRPGSEISSSEISPQTQYPSPNLHDALELCFLQKNLRGGAGSGINLPDVEKVDLHNLLIYLLHLHPY